MSQKLFLLLTFYNTTDLLFKIAVETDRETITDEDLKYFKEPDHQRKIFSLFGQKPSSDLVEVEEIRYIFTGASHG